MSISSFLEIEPKCHQSNPVNNLRDLSNRLCVQNLKINRGWEVWKKYKSFFPSSHFVILENRDTECVTIVTINKYNFLKKVEENIDIFKDVLGAHVTPSIILDNCLKSSNIFKEVLKNNEVLLGILLGFGRHNAQLFSRKMEIEREINNQKLSLTNKIPSCGFSTLEEEYRYINEKLTDFNEIGTPDLNPILMPIPGFAADHNHPETQQLKVEYTEQYKKIIKKCQSEKFLETILRQFCES